MSDSCSGSLKAINKRRLVSFTPSVCPTGATESDYSSRELPPTFFPLFGGSHRIKAEKRDARSTIMPGDHSSLSLAQHANLKTCPPRNTLQESAVRAAHPPLIPQSISAAETNESLKQRKVLPPKSATGFLLMDSLLNLISFNGEAVQILNYPEKFAGSTPSDGLLTRRIRSDLISRGCSDESPFVTEFQSGRRRYFCRVFLLDSNAKEPSHLSIAVLLERGPSGLIPLSRVSDQFNLTRREREVLEYLLQGMSSREIANRMNVSPSTVKAFLRLIMIKTRASSRSAILGKIIMSQT
jgi:DNA-binding CsgD family transcriptional regulator